jgi:hypothetical protein
VKTDQKPAQNPLKRRRLAVFAMGIALAVGQLASFGHLAMERHTACAEHKALVHSDSPHLSVEAGVKGDVGLALVPESAHGDHEHCEQVLVRDEFQLDPCGETLARVAATDWARTRGAPPEGHAQGISILRIAPKGSPPAFFFRA